MLIDSHCHIHDPSFYPDGSEDVYSRARQAGITMLVVGTSQVDSRTAAKFAESHDATWAIVGVHPHEAKTGWSDIEAVLEESSARIVGVGEIGLDYFYMHSSREQQIAALEAQLQLARDNSLPISFHVRDAFDDFWPVVDNFPGISGVLHSFTDSKDNLEAGLSRGFYIGINGISTFTKDVAQQAMFASVPLSRTLLETDAPFLTPRQHRGKINEPTNVKLVAEHIASTLGVSYDEVAAMTAANTGEVFRLINA